MILKHYHPIKFASGLKEQKMYAKRLFNHITL